jgi:hypothetical protein
VDFYPLYSNCIWHSSASEGINLFTLYTRKVMAIDMDTSNQEIPMVTPMQEFISHLKSNFGYTSLDDSFWLNKEKSKIVTAYNEGVEDGGFFGNGNDYFERNY